MPNLTPQQRAWLLDLVASAVEDDDVATDDEKMGPDRRAFFDTLQDNLIGDLLA